MAAILLSTRSKEDVQEGTKRGTPEVNVLIPMLDPSKNTFHEHYRKGQNGLDRRDRVEWS
jgi:hypothetical protein